MNPQFDPTPGLRLPQPSVETGGHPAYTPQPAAPIVVPATPQTFNPVAQQPMQQPAQPQPVFQQPLPQLPQQPVIAQVENGQPDTPAAPVAPDSTDDAADEAWVDKARAVSAQYQDDPYQQSRALSRLKAEYIQTRYGKTLKVNEG